MFWWNDTCGFRILLRLLQASLEADCFSYTALTTACARTSQWQKALLLWTEMFQILGSIENFSGRGGCFGFCSWTSISGCKWNPATSATMPSWALAKRVVNGNWASSFSMMLLTLARSHEDVHKCHPVDSWILHMWKWNEMKTIQFVLAGRQGFNHTMWIH